MAISGDRAVVGRQFGNTAYVFDTASGALVADLNNPLPNDFDFFGDSVGISGNVALVGAPGDDPNSGSGVFSNAGSAYAFDATTGVLLATLENPTPVNDEGFGQSVAVSGGVAVVGADESVAGADYAGVAYRFDVQLAKPDYSASNIAWNVNRGPGVAIPERGFDLTFEMKETEEFPAIAFYWGDANGNKLTSAVQQLTSAEVAAGATQPFLPAGADRYLINIPARWGTPPTGTATIVAVFDPGNDVDEAREDDNTAFLRVHSPQEVLDDALRVVNNPLDGTAIAAVFVPNRASGQPLTLSEAEVVFGVDHFNWVQAVEPPDHIHLGIWKGTPSLRLDGSLVTEIGPDDRPKPVGVQFVSEAFPAFDPVVNDGGDYLYIARVELPDSTRFYRISVAGTPDAFTPYLQEDPADPASWRFHSDNGGTFSSQAFTFGDAPRFRQEAFPDTETFFKMTTQLVGVSADGQLITLPQGTGVTGFTWEWNSYTSGNVINFFGRPENASQIEGGGIVNVRYDDGTLVPGFAVVPGASLSRTLGVSGVPNGTAHRFAPDTTGQYSQKTAIAPFGEILANVRTATADVNGDGTEDTILVTGPGTPIRFAVVSGTDESTLLVAPTPPFSGSEDFTGGGFVSAADFDVDGRSEIIITPDLGGGPRITIFTLNPDGTLEIRGNFFGIDDPNFRGGARTGTGDVNGDGIPDLAVSAGFQGGPRIAIFNGATLTSAPDKLLNDFFAFEETLRNGAYVAIGDLDGDRFGDLLFGAGPGGAPRFLAVSGQNLLSSGPVAAIESPLANFFVGGNTADRGGVRVAAKGADGDDRADVIVASGEGAPARVRIYLRSNFTGTGEPETVQNLDVFDGVVLTDGVFIG